MCCASCEVRTEFIYICYVEESRPPLTTRPQRRSWEFCTVLYYADTVSSSSNTFRHHKHSLAQFHHSSYNNIPFEVKMFQDRQSKHVTRSCTPINSQRTSLSTILSPSSESASRSSNQEFPNILWNPNVHHRIHNIPQLSPYTEPDQSCPHHYVISL
jgi:hypothetical protein